MTKSFDIVVFGATGFTGKLVAEYLAREAPLSARLAIAGRNRRKLEEVGNATGQRFQIIEASVDDPASLLRMAKDARVIATTVGPYSRYGEPVVRAAIEGGAHCLDITGEPEFVGRMIQLYDQSARERGVRIVNCCGFDSIPHDLGVLYTLQFLDRNQPIVIEGFVQAKGGVSGGTWHSAVNAFSDLSRSRRAAAGIRVKSDRVGSTNLRVRYEEAVKGWVAPMPTIDPEIVLRSAALIDYGPKFRYGHYVRVGSPVTLAGLGAMVGGVVALSQLKPTRDLLLKWKQPGDGPDEATRKTNFFRGGIL